MLQFWKPAIERKIQKKFVRKEIPSGKEICEIQLLHLANKIKDVETDHAIDNYLPAIFDILGDLDKEELIKKVVSVEFNRFLNYYKKSKDLTQVPSRGGEIPTSGSVRYFINLGARDGFEWMELKDFLRETLDVGRDDVFKVDVKEGFSFFNTDAELAEKVMEVLNGTQHNGRKVNVEISKNDGSKNQGRRDHGGRDRKRDGGFSGRREGGSRDGARFKREGGNDRRSDSRDGGRRGEGRTFERKPSGDGSKSMFEKAKRSRRSN